MAEKCMKLIGTEFQGPMSVKLLFITNRSKLQVNVEQKSPKFNIFNIAEICFLLKKHEDTNIHYKIATKKITTVIESDLTIKLHMTCEKPKFTSNVLCKEDWCEWHSMHWAGVGNAQIQILINVMVNKRINIEMIKLYEDEEFTDFQLSTVEGTVAVHRACLAANSEVFKYMLRREWKETTEGRIQMEGVGLQTLKDFKDYIYLGTLPDAGLCPLLQLAMYYMMDKLKSECIMKLARTVKPENLLDILKYSFMNQLPELTHTVLMEMPKSILVDTYYQEMIKNQTKNSSDSENDEMAEQEQAKDDNVNDE